MPPTRTTRPARTANTAAIGPWRSLVRVNGLVRRLSDAHFAQYGLSAAQWGVLRSLSRLEARNHPEPRMSELGAELLVQPPSLSATIDRMVRMGLVFRRDDADDLRSRRVGLTPAGRARLRTAQDDHEAWVRTMLAGLTGPQQARLEALLTRLAAHLTTHLEPDASPRRARSQRPRHQRGTTP